MQTVQRGASPVVSNPASVRTSASEAATPFIFQLPAMSGVIGESAMRQSPIFLACGGCLP
jgi:hypothetical protein